MNFAVRQQCGDLLHTAVEDFLKLPLHNEAMHHDTEYSKRQSVADVMHQPCPVPAWLNVVGMMPQNIGTVRLSIHELKM